MAIVQVSRITHRKGLGENLPQLAGAELGWALDERRLFIGNGTLEEGAPVIGNTEILTELSDVAALTNYIYRGTAAGYTAQTGSTASDTIVRTVQERLDDIASVKNFGAVGDGIADDTDAINRALFQIFCVQDNDRSRRSLFFPAGTYKITKTIIIPSYARLIGEGADSTIIQLNTGDTSNLSLYVARLGDSLQQTDAGIGTNGAVAPRNIELQSMTLRARKATDVLLIEAATQCSFSNVNFEGPLTRNSIDADKNADNIAGIRVSNVAAPVSNSLTFESCGFRNLTYGVNTDSEIKSVTIANGLFDTLYQGIVLGSGTVSVDGPNGFRATGNKFDNIYKEGIVFNNVTMNVSAHNVFYDVGNDFTTSPSSPCITIGNDNNISMYDLFSRTDSQAQTQTRVSVVGGTVSTSSQIQIGHYSRETGKSFVLADNAADQTIVAVSTDNVRAFRIDYTVTRQAAVRHGTIMVTAHNSNSTLDSLTYCDDYAENLDTGIVLSVEQVTNSRAEFKYSSNNTGAPGTLTYSISHLA